MTDSPTHHLPDFDGLWDYGQPAESEIRFRALLPAAQADAGYHAELLTQIARALGLQQKFAEAHAVLDEAEALITPAMTRPRLRYLLERGRVFNSSGSKESARPLFIEAWEKGRASAEDAYAVDAAHMVAIVESGAAALDWNMKALAAAEASLQEQARKWLGSLYNNIGWTLHDLGDYEQALAIFEKALAYRRANGTPQQIRIARWSIARTLRSLGRIDEALAQQRNLLVENQTAGEDDGYTHEEIAECLLLLGQPDAAKPYFAQAHAALSQDIWLAQNEPERLSRLQNLGK